MNYENPLNKKKSSLLSQDSFLQSVLFNNYDLICVLDQEGLIKYVSRSICKKFGITSGNIIGRSYHELLQAGILEIRKGDFSKILNSKVDSKVDLSVYRRDGSIVYLESYTKNLLDHPQVAGILFNSRDITEYIESALSLQRRNTLENLINQISTQLINSPLQDIETLFKDSLRHLSEFIKAIKSQIFVLNNDTNSLESLSALVLNKQKAASVPDNLFEESIKETLDALVQGKVQLESSGYLKILLIPMVSPVKISGVIVLAIEKFEFSGNELQIFKRLGNILSGIYENTILTKRIERNENLLVSTELLSKSGSWRFSTSHNMFFISEGLAKLFRFKGEPIMTEFSSFMYKIAKSSRNSFVRSLKSTIAATGKTSGEIQLKSNETRPIFIHYEIEARRSPLTHGLEVYGFCTDISHKRAAEDYLKLQSQVLAQVGDPIMVTNPALEVVYMNEAAMAICGVNDGLQKAIKITNLIDFQLKKKQNLTAIVSSLEVGQIWKEEIYLQPKGCERTPFEISVKGILLDLEQTFGYSFILHSLADKYERELKAQRTQIIVENSPAVLFRIDPEDKYRIHYISENINQFGYSASELLETSFLDIMHTEDAITIVQLNRESKTKKGTPSFSGEFRIKKPNGSYAWVEDKCKDVLDKEGRIIMHEGLFQDITDRKNLQIFNAEKDKQYRVLAANIPQTNIFLLDRHRKYILAEGTNFEFWGLTPEDFEGQNVKDTAITDIDEINLLLDRVYFNREIIETDFVFKGRYYHRLLRPIIENEEVEYVLSIIRDIDEERRAKEDLLKSEEKYRALVEESTEIIFSLSETLDIEYISPNIYQFLGYPAVDVIGTSILDYLNPDDLDVFESMRREKDFLVNNQYMEFRARHISGKYKVFSSNGRLVDDKLGNKYYTGIARDISKLKEAQRDLFKAKEKAEQASKVKSQFLSVMSHEIRTPMNAVIGLAHLLMEENPRQDQLENLRTLQFSAENLMGLINDILDFNKIESGKVELERTPFNLKLLISRIIHSYSFQAKEKDISIFTSLDEKIPPILFGDSMRLSQIINNLVSNAIKFTENGHIKIILKVVRTGNTSCSIKFAIIDKGIGIPEDKIQIVFEAFTQASSATTRKFGGTGLGLAIVKRLIELHGSSIKVKSEVGLGSEFEFILDFDLLDISEGSDTTIHSKNTKSLQQASILVAEDNLVNQVLIRKFLKKWNVGKLMMASDGQEALDALQENDFSIVLLDIQMPIKDGFEVAREIRANCDPIKSKLPILVLSATSLNEIKSEMEEIGIDDFIPKPFLPEVLYEKLIKYLHPKEVT